MNWYAFTARNEVKAAQELREAGYDAYCVQMVDRRKRHRHRAKGSAVWEPRAIVALKGYVFLEADIPDLWSLAKLRHISQPVRFAQIQAAELAGRQLNRPKTKGARKWQ